MGDKVRRNLVTCIAVDVVNMYPSVRYSLIKKAVDHYCRKCGEEDKEKVRRCLEMLKFGMSNNYLNFRDEFFSYEGTGGINDVALAIGGHESAFLADLVISYVFDLLEERGVFAGAIYQGIYRDDGFFVLNGI